MGIYDRARPGTSFGGMELLHDVGGAVSVKFDHLYHCAVYPVWIKWVPHDYGNALSFLCSFSVFYGKRDGKLLTVIGRYRCQIWQ